MLPSLHRQPQFKGVHRCSAVFVLHLATTELKSISTAPQQYCSKKKIIFSAMLQDVMMYFPHSSTHLS